MIPYVPNYFAEVVANTAAALGWQIFFDFGHHEDVNGRQQNKAQASSDANKRRYPLVWLVMDFEEDKTELGVATVSPTLFICAKSDVAYDMKKRRDTTFLPVLYPIYEELIRQIGQSPKFKRPAFIPHTKIDRPFFKGETKDGNLFNDAVDAIQLKDLKLQIALPLC